MDLELSLCGSLHSPGLRPTHLIVAVLSSLPMETPRLFGFQGYSLETMQCARAIVGLSFRVAVLLSYI